MVNDENEMMIEYSEMTAFNFNSKEYQEVKKDIVDFKDAVHNFNCFTEDFLNRFRRAEA